MRSCCRSRPIVAVAPLIIILVKNTFWSLVICATVIAIFPIISNTTIGLRSVDPGLLSYFRMNKASRWQVLRRLRIPSALPFFMAGLRISSGLALIGAVVAEFVAGTGGRSAGLAYEILQSGFQLDIPRMFAALAADHGDRRTALRLHGAAQQGSARLARQRDGGGTMSGDIVIRGAIGILTGRRGAAERATGDIRIRDGRIQAAIGDGRTRDQATSVSTRRNCVVTPGLVSTHHHLFQSMLKGIPGRDRRRPRDMAASRAVYLLEPARRGGDGCCG